MNNPIFRHVWGIIWFRQDTLNFCPINTIYLIMWLNTMCTVTRDHFNINMSYWYRHFNHDHPVCMIWILAAEKNEKGCCAMLSNDNLSRCLLLPLFYPQTRPMSHRPIAGIHLFWLSLLRSRGGHKKRLLVVFCRICFVADWPVGYRCVLFITGI